MHILLSERGQLQQEYRALNVTYLMALDGAWLHSSEKIHCQECSVQENRDGRRTIFHRAVTPVFLRAGTNRVIAVEPEFIRPQDVKKKQDCVAPG